MTSRKLNGEITCPEKTLSELSVEWNVDVYSKEFSTRLDESGLWPTHRDKFFYPKLKDLPKTDLKLVEDINEECIYLCGNSLGLQPKLSREYVEKELDKWAKMYLFFVFQAIKRKILFSYISEAFLDTLKVKCLGNRVRIYVIIC